MQNKKAYAQVLLGIPLKEPLTYTIPKTLKTQVQIGSRCWVPFHKSRQVGYCVGLTDQADIPGLKSILSLIDTEPVLTPPLLKLTRWMSEYYAATWGECVQTALPGAVRWGRTQMRQSLSANEPLPKPDNPLELTTSQGEAFRRIQKAVEEGRHDVFLLHGVTASGKTEVYLQTVAQVLSQGRTGLILVPEIALISQTLEQFQARFGDTVGCYHSRLSVGERFRLWQKVRVGSVRVVVGTRSALFLPMLRLGLVVLDEEHEPAYKQEDTPRYHAREVAIERARLEKSVVILGSATPSLESYQRSEAGEFHRIELPERLEERSMPDVELIDMRREPRQDRRVPILSIQMIEAMARCIEKGEGILLFLNRRGFAPFIHCLKCGWVMQCKRCDVSLVYHAKEKKLQCHYCAFEEERIEICPKCDKGYLSYFGAGTERVESELARVFPQSRVIRMDRDTTSRKGSHRAIYEAFRKGDIHILLGTQMIAKGLHFPHVTLVAALSVDSLLNLPDFRSAERTFQLLMQVAGRAGRGSEPGRVLIQTFSPEHGIMESIKKHSYHSFLKTELSYRRSAGYPPYRRLINIVFRGRKEDLVAEAAQKFAHLVSKRMKGKAAQMIGPAPMPIPKLRTLYRWHVLIKAKKVGQWGHSLREWTRSVNRRGVRATIDVDPISML
jgi:primosomal protein N' (replication factor Y) (superfamily II helicase)